MKDQNINNLTEIKEKLEKQTAGLRQEVKHVESEINGKNSAIHALKQQIKFYKQQCQNVDIYKNEIKQLKKDNESLKKYIYFLNNFLIDFRERKRENIYVIYKLCYILQLKVNFTVCRLC